MTLKEIITIIIVILLLKIIHLLLPIIKKRWIAPAFNHIKHYIYQTAAYWTFVSIMVPLTIIQMILDDGGPPPYVPKSKRWKAKLLRWRSKFKEGCRSVPVQMIHISTKWWTVFWRKKKKNSTTDEVSKPRWGMNTLYCMMASTRRARKTSNKTERAFYANTYEIAIDSACILYHER
jgi:hypothetical protein